MLSSSYLANLVITRGIEQRLFHRLGDPMYTTGSRTVVFGFCLSRVYAIPLYYTCALIKLLIGILFSIFSASLQLFHIPWRNHWRQQKIKQFNRFAFKYLGSVLDGWFDRMVLTNKHIHSKKLSCVSYHFLGLLIFLYLRVLLFTARFR